MFTLDMDLMIRLIIAVILGATIGLERELKRKPLGLKTSSVISVISCLITIVSIELAYLLPKRVLIDIRMDPLRLAAQIISGVGFLGAGVIMRRRNEQISGLTTAAIIWGAAGIGVAVGAGFYIEAIAGVLLLLISVELIPFLVKKIAYKRLYKMNVLIKVILHRQDGIHYVIRELTEASYVITRKQIGNVDKGSGYTLKIKARVQQDQSIKDMYYEIKRLRDVKEVKVSN